MKNIDLVMPLFRLFQYSIVVGCKTRERRAPDNFLKQGVAGTYFEAKGVFLQNPEVFHSQVFTQRRFLGVNLVLSKRKNAAHNRSHNLPTLY